MAGFWTRLFQILRGRKSTQRARSVAQRYLRMELLEGRKLMANDLASITGKVVVDATDNDFDLADAPIVGATVTLFRDDDLNGIFNVGTETQVGAPVQTDAGGVYTFTGLIAGKYYVVQSAVSGKLQRAVESVQEIDISATDAIGDAVATTLIDDFNDGTETASADFGGTTPVDKVVTGLNVLGGQRDLFVDATGGNVGAKVELISDNLGTSNLLDFKSDATATGTRIVSYDGADVLAATLDTTTGLGGVDLTTGGGIAFRFKIGTDIASNLIMRVHSSNANSSSITVPITTTVGGAATADLVVRFDDFITATGTGANFTSVRAIELEFDGGAGGADGQVDTFEIAKAKSITQNFINLNPMSIGNLVWSDVDHDGVKDTGETGIGGVTVQLYTDTNGNGSYDNGTDTLVGTTTTSTVTATLGAYSFGNLFPDDYLAVVPISQFGAGQPLEDFVTSPGTATDPDDNIDNDDNGTLIAGVGVASAALTIASGAEPINDSDTDANTNFALDFGFAPQTDLTVTKTSTQTNAPAGGKVTYTLTARNDGILGATGVTVVDTIPVGTTVDSATGGTGAPVIDTNAGTVTYTVGALAAATNSSALTLVLNIPATATGTITNNVTVSGVELETDSTNNTGTLALTAARVAALTVTKTDTPDPVTAGQNVTYTLVARNTGPSTATNVVITDPLPTGLTFVSAVSSQGTATLIPAAGANPARVEVTVGTMNVDTVGVDTDVTVTIIMTVPAGFTGTTVSNVATIDSDESSPSTGDADTNVTKNIDLVVAKTANLTTAIAGNNITYSLAFSNQGPSTATNVKVKDVLPAGMTIVSVATTLGTRNTTDTSADVVIDIPTMNTGDSGIVTIVATVPASQTASLVNNSTISLVSTAGFTLLNTGDDASQLTTPVSRTVNLGITKAANPTSNITAGNNVTYTLTATNTGPSDATSVVVADNIPDGIKITSVTGTVGTTTIASSAITIPTSAQDDTAANADDISIAIANLAASGVNATATITIVGVVLPATRGSLVNAASISTTASGVTESDNTNNSASVTNTVTATTNLQIAKANNPNPVIAGQTLTYTIDVTNAGPSTATAVNLTDNLPDGIKITSVTGTVGSTSLATTAFTIPTTSQDDTAANNDDLIVNIGTLIPNVSTTTTPTTGSRATITIVGTVLGDTRGTITNSVSVVSAENTTPAATTSSTTANASLDLTITKVDTPDPVSNNGTLTYTLSVTNSGPSAARNVRVTDALPTGLTFVSGTASNGGTVSINAGTVTGTLGTVASGATVTVTILATVNITVPTDVTNTATVLTDDTESNPNNNTASATTRLGQVRSIAGRVFVDSNYTGRVMESTDPGLSGVVLTLFRVNGANRTQVATVTTGTDGTYQFDNLVEGSYELIQSSSILTFNSIFLGNGSNDTPGNGGSKTAKDTFSINLAGSNSTGNNFVWYIESPFHLCGPDMYAYQQPVE